MFCSRRKTPTSPCSCAFQLRGPLCELLNHLFRLGESTLVLRQQGLSLAKETCFGLSIANGEGSWQILRDHLSGLETDTRRQLMLYLLTDVSDRRPVIGMGEPGQPLHLTIRLHRHAWDSPATRNLIEHFKGLALGCQESRRLGAGAWLDDWQRAVPAGDGSILEEARRSVLGCRELVVAVRNPCQRAVASFEPTFVDTSGTVLRIADRGGRHVVHADVADPGFRIGREGRSRFRISVGDAPV